MNLIGNIRSLISKHTYYILGLIIILGILIRVFNLWDNIIFSFDQGRDAYRIMGIISFKHFKIVGPETDIQGIFNGPLFYYILAPFYFLSKLNPNGPALFIALVNSLAAIIVFYTGKVLFNKYVGLLSSIFWIFSFEQIAYSHYISNASFMGISAVIFFLGLALYFIRKKEIGLLISALGFGLSVNFNFYLVYLFGFYVIFFVFFPRKVFLKTVAISFLISAFLLSPFLLSQIQFHFVGVKSLVNYLSSQSPKSKSLATVGIDFNLYVKRLTDAFFNSFFSFSRNLAFIIFIAGLFFSYVRSKEKKPLYFLFVWIFSTFPLFAFHSGVLTVQVINSSLQGALCILMGLCVWYIFENKKYWIIGFVLIFISLISNFYLLKDSNFVPNKFFVSEPMILKEQKQVIDYTYSQANGGEFSICGITNPLLINTVWGYLYNWYGGQKYHYLPLWAGLKQDYIPSLLVYDANHTKLRFFIQEPLVGIEPKYLQSMIFMEDNTSILLDQKKFGGITVQKRILQDEPRKFVDTQNLNPQEISDLKMFISTTPLLSCYNTY